MSTEIQAAYPKKTGSNVVPTVFKVIIHPCADTDGYWAECPQLQGCNTNGKTMREVEMNMFEAVDLCLEDHLEPIDDYMLSFEVYNA